MTAPTAAPATAAPTKVSIVGVGRYGSTAAHRIVLAGIADQVVLLDVADGLAEGLALDLAQSQPLDGFRARVTGTTRYEDTAGSTVCIVAAGRARRPGMSRLDLLETNAAIVAEVVRQLVAHSPEAVLIVVSNPLDEMTALAAAVSQLPPGRVFGQAGLLDSARLRYFIAAELGVGPEHVEAFTLGSHGDTMVPILSRARVQGRPLTECLDATAIRRLVERTRDGGAEIVGLVKTGSAFYAPAAAALLMTTAVVADTGAVLPVCTYLKGEYGIDGVYLGVMARVGARGVSEVAELVLDEAERAQLLRAAEQVRPRQANAARIGLSGSLPHS